MLHGKRLIIIEDEFLIALDMQQAVAAAGAVEAVLLRDFEEAAAFGDGIAAFDLAIVPPPATGEPQHLSVLDRVRAAGLAVVVCSGVPRSVAGTLAGAEFLEKPFGDGDLVAACQRALARKIAPS